jgi:hypothetical protein
MYHQSLHRRAAKMRDDKRKVLEAQYPTLRSSPVVRTAVPARTGEHIVLGRTEQGHALALPERSRLEHMHLIGTTGGGKTNLIEHMARQDILNGRGVCVLDPHGEHPDSLFRRLLSWLHESGLAASRVIHLIDPNAPGYVSGFNPLAVPSGHDPAVIAEAALEAFQRLWGDEDPDSKPTIQRVLAATFTALAELQLTLAEARLLFDPEDLDGLRAYVVGKVRDEYAREELSWLQAMGSDRNGVRDVRIEVTGPRNRVSKLVRLEALRTIVGQTDCAIDLRTALDEGHIILANLSGGAQAYEKGADILGRLLVRFLLFHAKRRQKPHIPYFVYLDECQRYLSGDVPTLLAEVRKQGVGLVLAHQWQSQLASVDPEILSAVRSATNIKAVFRVKDQKEAADLAEMVVPLDLELAVHQLTRPTVVGHERTSFRNASTGRQASTTTTAGNSVSDTITEIDMDSISQTEGESTSEIFMETEGDSVAESYAETEGDSYSESFSESVGESYSGSRSVSRSSSLAEGNSQTDSSGSGESRGSSKSDSFTPLYGIVNIKRDQTGSTEGENRGASQNRGHADAHSTVSAESRGVTAGESWGSSSSSTSGESFGHSSSVTRGQTVGHSSSVTTGHTIGRSNSTSKGKTTGTSKGRTEGRSTSTGETHGTTDSSGWSEGIEPIYATLPTAVHSKENAIYFAAQTLRSLKTGTALINFVGEGGMRAEMVRVPKMNSIPLSAEAFEQLRQQVFAQSPSAIETTRAVAALQTREQNLIGAANKRRQADTPEPSNFRVPTGKRREAND